VQWAYPTEVIVDRVQSGRKALVAGCCSFVPDMPLRDSRDRRKNPAHPDLLVICRFGFSRILLWTIEKDVDELRRTEDHVLGSTDLDDFCYFVIVNHCPAPFFV
jgi:hypothetical protein